jgi:hypothetical protein
MRIVVALMSLLVCATAHAHLKWEKTTIELHLSAGDNQAIGHFKYENVGTHAIRFRSIRPSCGCTTATTQTEVVQPGDKGELTATFHIGDRTGTQTKTITVETDYPIPAYATAYLKLRAIIPQLLEIQPALVYWQPGEERTAKTINVKAAKDMTVKSINVSSSDPAFQTKVAKSGNGEFTVEVAPPADLAKWARTTITIQPENLARKFFAMAVVAAGRSR